MNKKILGIGNAIVDVFAKVDNEFLIKNNLVKGSMKLINKSEFENLEKNIKIEKIVAGGSVANTMAGIAYLKGSPSFIGKVSSDKFGDLYKKSLEDIDVNFSYIKKNESLPTGASIILITPDSERTMCTYLGISSHLAAHDISKNNILGHELIFLEGYLWDKGDSEIMFKHAINIAKQNKIKIGMSLSDIFCVTRHKQDFYNLFKNDLESDIDHLDKDIRSVNEQIAATEKENKMLTEKLASLRNSNDASYGMLQDTKLLYNQLLTGNWVLFVVLVGVIYKYRSSSGSTTL